MYERIKKVKGHEYRYLVKSVRIDGKVKQIFVKYLGRLDKEKIKKPPLQGFKKVLFDFINRHKGVSVAAISKHFLKRKEYINPVLAELQEFGLVVYDRGDWYPTSKEPKNKDEEK